ncbi:hypothetical protein J4427_03230 [Candidatus Woesearchaeota archaeon]|nr:hypothetical protein [Candidatus Woesearchaeota archaeon]
MEEITIFREFIGDNPTTRILEFLIEGKDFDYSLTDIANNSGVSWRTVHRIFPRFIKNNMVIKTRSIGRAQLYKINDKNESVNKLIELFNRLLIEDLRTIENKQLIKV